MLNPYYFVFVKVYKKLKSINVQDEGILFSTYSVLFLIFIPHFFILLFQLKDHAILTFNVNIPKPVFGVSFALFYWLINYLLFGWGKRYIRIIENYEKTTKPLKITNLVLLLIYFSLPFVLMIT